MDALSSPGSSSYHQRRNKSTTPPVYLRDFAYANNGPVLLPDPMRMANANIEKASAKTFAELLSGPTVDIYVGPDRKHWSLHKNLLCHHSSYFETEFRGYEVPKSEDKPQHNKLELPEDDPRGFELLVKWLYQGHLDGDDAEMTDENRYEYAVACCKLYLLCDKFDILLLKNLAMDEYRANLHLAQLVPDADEINEIYRSSPLDSPLRKLTTKIAARQIMDPGTGKDAKAYWVCFDNNADFAVDTVNAIKEMSGGGTLFRDPTIGDDCKEWHDHTDGSTCYTKAKIKLSHAIGDTHHQRVPNSAAKRAQQRPVELSADRSTARKPNATPKHSPSQAKATAVRPAQKLPSLDVTSKTNTSKRNITDSATHRMRDRLTKLNINGVQSTIESKSPAAPKPANLSQHGHPTNSAATPRRSYNLTPGQTPSTPSINGIGVGRASSGGSARPRKLNHVNGIVRQFDAANGSMGGSEYSSRSGVIGKRQPPKLKRKAPS